MSMTRRTIAFAVAAIVACWPQTGQAGEASVTKVRGTSITVDQGAEEGLEVGLTVTVVRPPEEAIIHPLTGENLGAPELELGTGEITKVSARAASIRLEKTPILPVRPTDVVRYITIDEQMMMEQEMVTVTAEKAAAERSTIRNEASKLSRNISGIQRAIKALEGSIRELRRFDNDVVKPQFNSINKEMEAIQEELKQLRESVTLMGSVDIDGMGEGEGLEGELSEAQIERFKQIEEKLAQLEGQVGSGVVSPGEQRPALPGEEGLPEDVPPAAEESAGIPIWVYLAVIGVGILGVGFWLFQKMSAGDGDDEEDEEDDEDDDGDFEDDEDEDEDEDLEIEEEEDDIVVEETQ